MGRPAETRLLLVLQNEERDSFGTLAQPKSLFAGKSRQGDGLRARSLSPRPGARRFFFSPHLSTTAS